MMILFLISEGVYTCGTVSWSFGFSFPCNSIVSKYSWAFHDMFAFMKALLSTRPVSVL